MRSHLVEVRVVAFATGCGLGLTSLVTYATAGYGSVVVALWLAGLALLAGAFALTGERIGRVSRADVFAAAGLMLAFAPLYLLGAHRWPVQVGSDEVSIMTNAKLYASRSGVDLLGVSDYLGHPAGLLVLLGRLGGALGGVSLLHMRLLHGALGLAVIAASYALLRQLLPLRWAVFAACVTGLSHSLLMISRMAMRENSSVLLEVIALALLLRGLRHGHRLTSYLGGVVAGLGFYVYYPARFTIVIWAAFVVGMAVFGRANVSVRRLRRAAAATALGFVLVATPILVSERQAPPEQVYLQRNAMLIYPEARKTQQEWVFADTEWEGIRKNIEWGLSAFNNRVVDHSFIYENPGHGFIDPLSGILLWIGAVITLVAVVRRREDRWALLVLAAFAILWLSFALLINKAPNYTRLLVTLPFVAYFVTVAVRSLASAAGSLAGRTRAGIARPATGALAVAALLLVAGANASIARDYMDRGAEHGDIIGNTGRYIEAQRAVAATTFYVATDDSDAYRYYDWGYPAIWKERLSIFAADPERVGEVISPSALADFEGPRPFAVFMRRELWATAGRKLVERYGTVVTRPLMPDGSRIVAEVPGAPA